MFGPNPSLIRKKVEFKSFLSIIRFCAKGEIAVNSVHPLEEGVRSLISYHLGDVLLLLQFFIRVIFLAETLSY